MVQTKHCKEHHKDNEVEVEVKPTGDQRFVHNNLQHINNTQTVIQNLMQPLHIQMCYVQEGCQLENMSNTIKSVAK